MSATNPSTSNHSGARADPESVCGLTTIVGIPVSVSRLDASSPSTPGFASENHR